MVHLLSPPRLGGRWRWVLCRQRTVVPCRSQPGAVKDPAPAHRVGVSAKHHRGDGDGPRECYASSGDTPVLGPVEFFELPGPGMLRPDEVLLEARFAGVGNWDDIARTGGWYLGRHPPMGLGVEAAGVAARTGGAVAGVVAGDRVMTHSLPLRGQGAWAEWFVAAASDVAPVPDAVPFEVAAALPVPALTADQVLRGALGAGPGATVSKG